MDINTVTLSGNVARDAEMRYTKSGGTVISFPIAVGETVGGGDGQTSTRTSYFDVACFFGTDHLRAALGKGSHVTVSGRLRQDRWQDKQTGENRSRLGIVADEVDVMTPRDRGQERQEPAQQQVARTPYAAPPAAPADPYDEDIPF